MTEHDSASPRRTPIRLDLPMQRRFLAQHPRRTMPDSTCTIPRSALSSSPCLARTSAVANFGHRQTSLGTCTHASLRSLNKAVTARRRSAYALLSLHR
ncbi:hypothetical protein BDY17DRAFT_303559 [Neohortaea acidophila]|uniref:Uncharacterized protein n=1 Tax=Neohortaea acidophila TaxID=245834 RepID=A0A6A6PKU5_9PEZI|nr:uncharacterized protein BDY17DRAFT_303559 [Neohortaea acidophila]KAF2480284.1 hypothetical protein BDY17DRAFT_303559 [Neohortaea acidophila]